MKKSREKNKLFVLRLNYRKYKPEDIVEIFQKGRKKLDFKKILFFIQEKPFTSFFSVLAVFLILMILGNLIFSPRPTKEQSNKTYKKVNIYKIGSAPQVSYQGKIEKSGVVKIIAQTPGIVSNINVYEGQSVYRGTNILSLSTNYQGGNAQSISRQIAQNQYQNVKDTFNSQKDLIQAQRDLANKNKDNSDQLRDITNKTVEDTQNLVSLDQSIVDTLNQNLLSLNPSDPLYLQTKQQISQFQSAVVQLNGSIRSLQYQGASDKPPADLTNIQKDIAIRGLDLQEKALNVNLETAKLSYNLALVYEANMYPSSPIAGTVDRVFVRIGDNIGSGTPLVSISGLSQHAQIIVNVPANIAKSISEIEPSTIEIGKNKIEQRPFYVSKDATNGTLYSIVYQLDDSLSSKLTDGNYVDVRIPIGVGDTTNAVPFVPLDSVIQTQEEAFIYVVDKNMTARVKKVVLGQIQGKYVEVLSGIPAESQVIINRNVIEGDNVQVIP